MMPNPIRIILTDDHAILRAGVAALITGEADLDLVAEAASGEDAVGQTIELKPDVVVMDLEMPGLNGLEATRRIVDESPATKVIIMTSHSEDTHLVPALMAGASGYVAKSRAHEDLVGAIRAVGRGDVSLSAAGTSLLVRAFREVDQEDRPGPLAALSPRENQILAMTAEGFTANEAGRTLHLSPKTVETYRSRVMAKLGIGHRSELVRFAVRHGLIQGGDGTGPIEPANDRHSVT